MWLATGSLLTVWWRMQVSGAGIGAASFLLAMTVACLPPCLQWWGGACTQQVSFPLVFCSILCSVSGSCCKLEPFAGKFSILFFLLWRSHSLGCCPTLAPSDCPQDVQAQPFPKGPMMLLAPPYPAPTCWWQMRASGLLLPGNCGQAPILWVIFFFSSQICCPLRFQNSPQTHLYEGFLLFGNFSSSMQRRKWQPSPVFLPGESQGWGSLVGCHLWGRKESDTTKVTQQQQQQQQPPS